MKPSDGKTRDIKAYTLLYRPYTLLYRPIHHKFYYIRVAICHCIYTSHNGIMYGFVFMVHFVTYKKTKAMSIRRSAGSHDPFKKMFLKL